VVQLVKNVIWRFPGEWLHEVHSTRLITRKNFTVDKNIFIAMVYIPVSALAFYFSSFCTFISGNSFVRLQFYTKYVKHFIFVTSPFRTSSTLLIST